MSITVRLWTDKELKAVKRDKWLATLLMNATTLTEGMASSYPYEQRREYQCEWVDTEPEVITIYATDERMLLKFIDAEYNHQPKFIFQVITQYRPINIS